MLNPHPPLTGFPLVLITIAVLAEIVCLLIGEKRRRAETWKQAKDKVHWFGRTCLILAAIVSPITYYSGYWGSEAANQAFTVPPDVIVNHQSTAKLFLLLLYSTLIIGIANWLGTHGKRQLRAVYLVLLIASLACVSYTSHLGGQLVFTHGAAVNPQ